MISGNRHFILPGNHYILYPLSNHFGHHITLVVILRIYISCKYKWHSETGPHIGYDLLSYIPIFNLLTQIPNC